jgi:DNA-binding transcriptional LysR family regulator
MTHHRGLDALCPQLVRFAAVARTQHVTRAAAELGLPQPTLSRSIARLERELGVPLFAREGRTLRLTRHGRRLLDSVESALAEIESGVAALESDADEVHGTVALAFLYTLGRSTVPELLRAFRAAHPGIGLTLAQDDAGRMLARLRAGAVDLVLTSPLPDVPGVAVRPLGREPLALVVPRGHRMARRTAIRFADAAAEEFVCLAPGYGLRDIFEDLCRTSGVAPRVVMEAGEVDTVRALAAAGFGVALLPATAPRHDPGDGTAEVPVADASRTIGLAWADDRPRTAAVRLFTDFVLERGLLPATSPRLTP